MITAPLFLVLGLSGAALVFRPELDEALTGPPTVTRGVTVTSLDAVLGAALLAHPRAEAHALRVPLRPDRPYRVELHHGAQRLDVAVDPATLRVVGARAPQRSVFVAVQSLHGAFHGGRAGAVVVGFLGLWLVVESLTGLSLDRRARSRSVHRLVGALSLVLAVVIGVTGALLALAGAVGLGGGGAPRPPSGDGLRRLDAVAARVGTVRPGARVVAIVAEGERTLRVDVRDAASGAAGTMSVDAVSGELRRAAPRGGWDLVRRLHAGEFAGVGSRTLYALVGLALPLLSVTGFVTALRRRARPQSSKVLT